MVSVVAVVLFLLVDGGRWIEGWWFGKTRAERRSK